jgi:2-C-methyl-D-erythritol 4-phosphate cytidylyltransferase/2-C-methyl-D-erythritol 2,4-cyclodiphosphate synthase
MIPDGPGYWLVVPAAGSGARMGGGLPKQYLPLGGSTVLEQSLRPFLSDPRLRGVRIALAVDDRRWPQLAAAADARIRTVTGGAERAHSVLAALDALLTEAAADDWVLVHDAARPCLSAADRDALLAACRDHAVGGLLAVPLGDTLKRATAGTVATVSREGLWRALTPQMFRLAALRTALTTALAARRSVTDEAAAVEAMGQQPLLVEGSPFNIKVTRPADLEFAAMVLDTLQPVARTATALRVGSGFDVHAFGPGDHVMLGGVRLPHDRGVVAHSDGDVLLHALCDALLGAAGLGDIGQHFSDRDERWRDISSLILTRHVMQLLQERGLGVVNADLTLLAEAPRLGSQRAAIVASVATALRVSHDRVNLKATTTEQLGYIGRREGLAAQAVVLLAPAAGDSG